MPRSEHSQPLARLTVLLTQIHGKVKLLKAPAPRSPLADMERHLFELIETYGIFAVFAMCTVEGDITLLISGVLAHSEFFGRYSFLKVLVMGTAGGMVGDCASYLIGRTFHENAKHYRFFQ